MKVDEGKIREIARKLGVSERTVEEYLLDRLTMQQPTTVKSRYDDKAFVSALGRARARAEAVDAMAEPVEEQQAG